MPTILQALRYAAAMAIGPSANSRAMNPLLAAVALLCAASCTPAPRARDDMPSRDALDAIAQAPASFPGDWLGCWHGPLEILGPRASAGEVTMELTVEATDDPARYRWTVVYEDASERQVRAYELVVRDAAEGRFAIDERNGVVLEARMIAGVLRSWFTIAGVHITTREQLVRDADGPRIEVEIVSSSDRDTVSTGPNGEVLSLAPVSVQRATLRPAASRSPER